MPRAARAAPASTVSAMPSAPMRAPLGAPRAGAEASARPQMAAPAPEPQSAPALRITSFPQLVALAGEKRDLLTKAALEADMRLVRMEDGRLEVALERHAARGAGQRSLAQARAMDRPALDRDRLQRGRPADAAFAERSARRTNKRERAAEADPRVQEVLARFPGAKVVEVRRLAAEPPESDVISEDPAESSDSDDD